MCEGLYAGPGIREGCLLAFPTAACLQVATCPGCGPARGLQTCCHCSARPAWQPPLQRLYVTPDTSQLPLMSQSSGESTAPCGRPVQTVANNDSAQKMRPKRGFPQIAAGPLPCHVVTKCCARRCRTPERCEYTPTRCSDSLLESGGRWGGRVPCLLGEALPALATRSNRDRSLLSIPLTWSPWPPGVEGQLFGKKATGFLPNV